MHRPLAAALFFAIYIGSLSAGEVEILGVEVRRTGGSSYHFDVTLRHGDTGWEHYADAWEILSPEGSILGRRVLYHPHVEEQPFTRSLGPVEIPDDSNHVLIRARDKVHGCSDQYFRVDLPR